MTPCSVVQIPKKVRRLRADIDWMKNLLQTTGERLRTGLIKGWRADMTYLPGAAPLFAHIREILMHSWMPSCYAFHIAAPVGVECGGICSGRRRHTNLGSDGILPTEIAYALMFATPLQRVWNTGEITGVSWR